MSPLKAVVERYIDGFRRTDHDAILGCVTDDVEWVLHGYTSLRGKAAFDKEIENAAFVGQPTLHLDQLVEEGDTVVAMGRGRAERRDGDPLDFVFSDVFTFRGDKICRLETYQVNLT